jgi:hypothetical protein
MVSPFPPWQLEVVLMTRLTLSLVALLCCLSFASGAFKPRKNGPAFWKDPPSREAKRAAPQKPKPQFVINEKTEIRLDGRACKYEDVPPTAEVIRLDLSSDRKVVLKIHFKSKQ